MVWKFLLGSCHFLQIHNPGQSLIAHKCMYLFEKTNKLDTSPLAKIRYELSQLAACLHHSKTVGGRVPTGGLYPLWKLESPTHSILRQVWSFWEPGHHSSPATHLKACQLSMTEAPKGKGKERKRQGLEWKKKPSLRVQIGGACKVCSTVLGLTLTKSLCGGQVRWLTWSRFKIKLLIVLHMHARTRARTRSRAHTHTQSLIQAYIALDFSS